MLPLVIAFAALGAGKCWLSVMGQHYQSNHAVMLAAFDNFLRLVAALPFWTLSAFLATGSFATAISRFHPYTFLPFCTHVMMMWLIAPVIGTLLGRFRQPGYSHSLLMCRTLALT